MTGGGKLRSLGRTAGLDWFQVTICSLVEMVYVGYACKKEKSRHWGTYTWISSGS